MQFFAHTRHCCDFANVRPRSGCNPCNDAYATLTTNAGARKRGRSQPSGIYRTRRLGRETERKCSRQGPTDGIWPCGSWRPRYGSLAVSACLRSNRYRSGWGAQCSLSGKHDAWDCPTNGLPYVARSGIHQSCPTSPDVPPCYVGHTSLFAALRAKYGRGGEI